LSKSWYVYIIKATDNKLYTGVTVDMARRWAEHCTVSVKSSKGAKFFRGRKPKALVFFMKSDNRSTACKEESVIKKLKREQKMSLISSNQNQLNQYADLQNLWNK